MSADQTASGIRVITEPSVYVIGRQTIDDAGLNRFLADHGVSWQTDTTVAGEVISETAGRACFDEATEILTNRGWKRFSELDRTEAVMTLDPRTLAAEWQTPEAYQTYEYDGLLKCAEGRDVSFAVTPEHRLYGTFRYYEPRSGLEFQPVSAVGQRKFCIPSAPSRWDGWVPESVTIPEVRVVQSVANQFGRNLGSAAVVRPEIVLRSRKKILALARLLVYYATEGSPRQSRRAGTGVLIYGDHVPGVAALCETLELPYSVSVDARNNCPRVTIGGGRRWLNFFVTNGGKGSANKRLPQWVLDLPAAELAVIWELLVQTDGHEYANGRQVLVTSSPTLAGQAQEILCKIGASSAVRPMTGGTNHPMYMVSRKHGRPIHLNDKVAIEDRHYRGTVSCVTTRNGIVYVRRNGVVHFSGNCYMSFAKPRPGGNSAYLNHIKEVGHGSVLEHAVWNFLITGVSRSLTHELVRHRAGFGYSQLSQRYVDESIAEYVAPDVIAADPELHAIWLEAIATSHATYMVLVDRLNAKFADPQASAAAMLPPDADRTAKRKAARQAARSVLPNATETKIFVTANARALRHFLEQRGSVAAEPEIRKLANKMLDILQAESPNLFGDFERVPLPDGTFDLQTPYKKV
jgi:thymidylate synthase (FAD)